MVPLKILKMSVAHDENSFQSSTRCAQEFADDGNGIGLAHLGDQFAAPDVADGVDEIGDHRPHGRAQPIGRRRRERGGDQSAQAGMLLALHREDGCATATRSIGLGQARHSREHRQRRMKALVPQNGRHVLQPGHAVAHFGAGQPVFRPSRVNGRDRLTTLHAHGLE